MANEVTYDEKNCNRSLQCYLAIIKNEFILLIESDWAFEIVAGKICINVFASFENMRYLEVRPSSLTH